MTKRKKTVAILSVAICVLTVGASVLVSNGFIAGQDPVSGEQLEVTEGSNISGIHFTSVNYATNSDGTGSITVSYTTDARDQSAVDLNSYIDWATSSTSGVTVSNWETTDWASGKSIESYLTYSIDQANCNVTINCAQAFGTTAVLTLEDIYDSSINASMLIDYRRKITTHSTASISDASFTSGQAITITASAEAYSIGSVGDRARDTITPTLTKTYSGGTSSYSTFASLFDSVIVGTYDESWKYQGTTYTDSDEMLDVMISNVKTYLESIPTTDGSVTFSADTFKNYLLYGACTRAQGTSLHYSTQSNIYDSFIDRYNAAYEAGGGYIVTADLGYDVDDQAAQTFPIELNVTTNTITTISLPGSIEF